MIAAPRNPSKKFPIRSIHTFRNSITMGNGISSATTGGFGVPPSTRSAGGHTTAAIGCGTPEAGLGYPLSLGDGHPIITVAGAGCPVLDGSGDPEESTRGPGGVGPRPRILSVGVPSTTTIVHHSSILVLTRCSLRKGVVVGTFSP